jgi:hypothetical protein
MERVQDFPDQSRVWVYQASRPFHAQDVSAIRAALSNFAQQWVSHNRQLRAAADVLHDRFVVLMVDETQAGASGCSIDRSVAYLKQLSAETGVDLFDRLRFSFRGPDGQVNTVSREEFARLYAEGGINDDTPVFDPLVDTKAAFDAAFEKKLGQSWHRRMV